MAQVTSAVLDELRRKLDRHFNEAELKDLCLNLAIDYENLAGQSKADKVRELVLFCERHGRIPDLVAQCRELRPHVDWPASPEVMSREKIQDRQPLAGDVVGRQISTGRGCYLQYSKLIIALIIALVFVIIAICVILKVSNAATVVQGLQAMGLLPSPTSTLTPTSTSSATPMSTLTPTPTRTPTHTPTHTSTSTSSSTPTPTPTPAVVVALRTWSDRYVAVTDITSTWRLKAQVASIGEQQKFTLLCLANGKAVFQILDRFVSALNDEDDRNWELRAVTTERLTWEELTLIDPDTQNELSCNQVLEQLKQGQARLAFRTFHGRFVTAMGEDKDWVLRAETTVLDRYEKFIVINLSFCPTQRDYRCLQGTMTPVATGASDMYCAETVTLPRPTLAHTVYISMTKRALADFGYSLYEVEAYGPVHPSWNLLNGGTVAVSSTEDSQHIAPNAIDGNLLTRWASAKCCKYGNCSQDDKGNLQCDNLDGQDPQWLKITLPKPMTVDRIVLKWERAYAVGYCVIINP